MRSSKDSILSSAFGGGGVFDTGVADTDSRAGLAGADGVILIRLPSDSCNSGRGEEVCERGALLILICGCGASEVC